MMTPLINLELDIGVSKQYYICNSISYLLFNKIYMSFVGYSLPSELEYINTEKLTYNMQNLEVENAMLKNELNVVNREVSELLDRLRKTEDGEYLCNISTNNILHVNILY